MLADGVSYRDVGLAVGVSRQAVLHWTRNPVFAAALDSYRAQQAELAQQAARAAAEQRAHADADAERQAQVDAADRYRRARAAMADPELRAERRVQLALEASRMRGNLPAMIAVHERMTATLHTVADRLLESGDLRGWIELYTRLSDRTGHGPPTAKDGAAPPPPRPYTPEEVEAMSRRILARLAPTAPTHSLDCTPPSALPAEEVDP